MISQKDIIQDLKEFQFYDITSESNFNLSEQRCNCGMDFKYLSGLFIICTCPQKNVIKVRQKYAERELSYECIRFKLFLCEPTPYEHCSQGGTFLYPVTK